jgi:methionine aminotransferase
MSKLPHVGTTIFTVMSKLALENNAINLSQGFPNFPVDETLTNILEKSANRNIHQYAPMAGLPSLLTNIGKLVEKSYQRLVNPEKEMLITAGATQSIFTAITAFVNQGDEVVMLDPCYDCYEPAVVLAGGTPVRIPLNSNYLPDWERIDSVMSERAILLIINNPHNPSGRVFEENDIEQLELLLEKYPKVILLSDEVYEYITFEQKHISINTRKKLSDRSIIVSSFGKTFHITGWKVGYVIAPEHLMIELKKVHQFLVFSVNSVAQAILADYLEIVDVAQLGSFYQEKRDYFRSLLQQSRFELLSCEGTYFQVASYDSISSLNDRDFCKYLVEEHGVAAIPLSVFNATNEDRKHIRFCFAKNSETLKQAAERLCKI